MGVDSRIYNALLSLFGNVVFLKNFSFAVYHKSYQGFLYCKHSSKKYLSKNFDKQDLDSARSEDMKRNFK
ncbi:hypothetical protein HFN_1497 [Helicobacter fennelliae MRY12-0050]|uniref:Uncharacterized protein n=1 Tax=Helicobacter fennelliae MRY12-0050 TaxID=1325130 RepID=T1DUK7_9HELI|nr:hypothetical protein HFN_1497 [Helicobacter fennelliae MRY12-0050]